MVCVQSCNRSFIEQYISFYYSQLIGVNVFHYAAHVNGYATRRSWMCNRFQMIFTLYSYGFKVVSKKIIDGSPPPQMNFISVSSFESDRENQFPIGRSYVVSRWNHNIKFQHSTTRQIGTFCCLFRG